MKKVLFSVITLLIVFASREYVMAQRNPSATQEQSLKYQRLMQMIDAMYVDSVSLEKLTEDAIVKVLADLDPHSKYISKENVEQANAPLDGGFCGIGIHFSLFKDTVVVVEVIADGPSRKAGILSGDRIIAVDGENIAGIGISHADALERLKGEKGSIVGLKIKRASKMIDLEITRDIVPIRSVEVSYMIDKSIGYIKVARFATTTIGEFEKAVQELQKQGMKDLIIDLQGNGGGYLEAAVGLADHLLDGQKLIVYMDTPNGQRLSESSTPAGVLQQGRVVALINENTASASEVLSGALQDWDRGLIVGRRSFGKGLVQRPFQLTDGAIVRLTTAHYFTPSGRCIQKPYKGNNYQSEVFERYNSGEMFSVDSIELNDTTKYYTQKEHRLVYGGGGIIPDVFVPVDTGMNYSYFNQLQTKGIIGKYVLNYLDKNRASLNKKYPKFERFDKEFQVTDDMLDEIVKYAEEQGLEKDDKLFTPVVPNIRMTVKLLITRDLWGNSEYHRVLNEYNPILDAGVKALRDGTYEWTIK